MRRLDCAREVVATVAALALLTVVAGCRPPKTTKNILSVAGEFEDVDAGALISRGEIRLDENAFGFDESLKIRFPLGDTGKEIELELEPRSAKSLHLPPGQSAWVGRVPGGGQAFFMRVGDLIEGRVPLGNKVYRVRSRTPTAAIMEVFDSRVFLDESMAEDAPEAPAPHTPTTDGTIEPGLVGEPDGASVAPSCEDPAHRIDVMVLYTKDAAEGAEAHWTPPDDYTPPEDALTPIERQIHYAIGQAKLAFANSEDPRWLNLIYTGPAPEELSEAKYVQGFPYATNKELRGFYLSALSTTPDLSPDVSAALESDPNFESEVVWSDPTFDIVHGRRDSVRADLVSLVYESLMSQSEVVETCGQADLLMEKADPGATATMAFSIVKRSCSDAHLSLAHEIGHNLGADHNCNASVGRYNCGFTRPVPGESQTTPWRTVMSYGLYCGCRASVASGDGTVPDVPPLCWSDCTDDADCGTGLICGKSDKCIGSKSCERIAWFSNPDVEYPETPPADATGDANYADNVRAFEELAGDVSQYRCLDSGKDANIWMKDDWEDQGAEPEGAAPPDTAMWRSPYIWVRQSEDKTLGDESQHFWREHQHQNPVKDEPNYLYVKLLNTGGKPETAPLEIYYADASTGLNDPSDWKRINDPSENRTIGAGTVEVAQLPWSGPDTGPYSLLARWNVDGTPLEFTNLAMAVYVDNDLIWRNVHIIDLGETPDNDTVFAVPADEPPPGSPSPGPTNHAHIANPDTYLVITTNPMSRRKIDWDKTVNAWIKVDPRVLDLSPGIGRTDRLEQKSDGVFKVPLNKGVKLLGPFKVPRKEPTRVTLTTSVNPSSMDKVETQLKNSVHYDITVMQIRPSGVKYFEDTARLFRTTAVIGGVSYTLRVPVGR